MDILKNFNIHLTSELSFNILLHICILFTILHVFFIYYITKLTTNAINNEVNHIINKGIKKINEKKNNIKSMYDIPYFKIAKEKFDYNYYENLFKKEDITRKYNNENVFFYTKIVNALLFLFLYFMGYYLVNNNLLTTDIIRLMIFENVLTFLFVAIVEYLFFTNVALNYIPAPPSILYKSFLESLNNIFN